MAVKPLVIVIGDLALPPGRWTLKHLGSIERPTSIPDAARVFARFVKLREGALEGAEPEGDEIYDEQSLAQPFSCELPASERALLSLGEIYEGNRKVALGPDRLFKDLPVDLRDGQWRVVKGDFLTIGDEDGPYLTDSTFYLDEPAREEWFLLAKVISPPTSHVDRWIVVPCAEAVRFWYLTSSNLTTLLLNGALEQHSPPERNGVYDVAESVPRDPETFEPKPLEKGGLVFVQRRRDTVMEDAAIIGNIAYSHPDAHPENVARGHRAYEGAVEIFGSLEKSWAASGQKTARLKVMPPFRGIVQLHVRGRVVELSDHRRTLVVSCMVSSDEPFPFGPAGLLMHDRDNNNESDGIDDQNRPEAYKGTRGSGKSDGEEGDAKPDTSVVGGRPATRSNPKVISLDNSPRFLSLKDKVPRAVTRKSMCTSRAGKRLPSPPLGPDVSTDPGTDKHSELGPASIRDKVAPEPPEPQPASAGHLPADLQSFADLKAHLDSLGAETRFVDLGHSGGSEAMAALPALTSCRWSFLQYFKPNDPRNVARHALILEVQWQRRHAYFIEIERSTRGAGERFSFIALRQVSPESAVVDAETLGEVLRGCARRRSAVLPRNVLPNLYREQGRHHYASLSAWADAVLRFTSGKSLRAERVTKSPRASAADSCGSGEEEALAATPDTQAHEPAEPAVTPGLAGVS